MKLHYLEVKMARHEWQGTHSMAGFAEEQIRQHPELEHLVVSVREHAGWFLTYALVDGQLTVVDTANDQAYVTPARRKFWETVRGAEWIYLPTIYRPEMCSTSGC